MFDKFKQAQNLLKLRSEAKKLQEELDQIKHTEEDGDMSVTVSGSQTVLNIKMNGEDQERLMKLINRALKEVQKKSAKKMMEMGGGLGGLLGGMGQ
jgi:DNA-binding protein YbaB